MIKKTRHLVESFLRQVKIQNDHSSILDIMQQFSITSTASIIEMNVWLITVSQFFCAFRLWVCHKPGKEYVMLDALI